LIEGDLSAQVLGLCSQEPVLRTAATATSSPSAESSAPASRFALAAASNRSARRAGSDVSIAARSTNAPPPPSPHEPGTAGRALELLRDLLVWPGRRVGAVPGATVGSTFRIGGLGEGGVGSCLS